MKLYKYEFYENYIFSLNITLNITISAPSLVSILSIFSSPHYHYIGNYLPPPGPPPPSPATLVFGPWTLIVALRRTFIPNSHLYIPMAFFLLFTFFVVVFLSTYVRRSSAAFHRRKGGLGPSIVNSLPLVAYGEGAKQQMIYRRLYNLIKRV